MYWSGDVACGVISTGENGFYDVFMSPCLSLPESYLGSLVDNN